jgi:hypothetical protein
MTSVAEMQDWMLDSCPNIAKSPAVGTMERTTIMIRYRSA